MNGVNEILGRVIRKEVKVNASVEEVWEAWTTSEGATRFFAPKARIELTLGGRYELFFDLEAPKGSQGSEGCRVLSFLPMEMLSFEWNAPPEFPEVRRQQMQKHTWVVVQFSQLAQGQVKVRLTHLGWREGEEWDKVFQYFLRAWDIALGRLERMFSTGEPIDWEKPVLSTQGQNLLNLKFSARNAFTWHKLDKDGVCGRHHTLCIPPATRILFI